jgi:hypothetical protein
VSKLQGFSKRENQDDRGPRQPMVSRRPEPMPRPDPQPAGKRQGRDTEIGHLAQLFQQYARADGIELRKGYPVICTEINDLVTRWHLREKHFEQYADACERRCLPDDQAAKCWYHTRTDVRHRAITWVEMVEVIMAEFWSRIWDEHALDYFRQYFAEFGRAAVRHWASLSAVEAINARPKQPRAVMRRRMPDATMPDGIKEGE